MHILQLNSRAFNAIKLHEKTIEVRANKGCIENILAGNIIKFQCNN
jgi:ASC-1-like (ASCH) protein